jgi:flagellar hook-length control protein FliK
VAQQAAAAIPLSGVAFEITSKALTSTNHFEIRLDPPDLGRIEVRLDVDKDGNVTSNMIVDRPETLDLLRRDAAGLDRALQDAGLKTSNNGLQFQLRDQSSNQQQDGNASNTARIVVQDETIPNTAIARDYGRLAGNSGGVDIQV